MNDGDETRHIPSDEELAGAHRAVEDVLGDVSLSDAALWAEPSAELEDRIMDAIAAPDAGVASVTTLAKSRRSRLAWIPAGIAAGLIALVAVVALRGDNPDWQVALGATEDAPGVAATVLGWNEASGTRVQLDIDGLAPAPAGFVYEFWFSNGPTHISAGTFHSAGDDVTLWAGVGRAAFPRLWITLEPLDDGDPGPGLNLLDTEIAS